MSVQNDNLHGNFSPVVEAYEKGRHEYPVEVINWVKSIIKGNSILDMGCGTGISTRQLAKTGFQVTGLDPSKEMVIKAEQITDPPCKYIVATAELIPFPDSYFDGVTAFTAFHWFDNTVALQEIKRVLKPQCPFCIIHELPGDGPNDPSHHRPIIEKVVGHKLPHAYEDFDPARSLKNNGFQNVTSEVFKYQEEKTVEDTLLFVQSTSLWNYIPDDKKESTLRLLRNHFQKAFPDEMVKRTWRVNMVAGYK